jgi:hypothetical protein
MLKILLVRAGALDYEHLGLWGKRALKARY